MRVGPVFSPRTMLVIVLSILFAGQTVNSAHGEVTYPTAVDPRWVAVADLNGDGHVDVATSNLGSVSVLLNRGDGKLLPHVDYAAPGHALIADINGDGSLDIVAAADSGVTALIGNGNGTFQAGILSRFNCGIDTVSLAVGDFNSDRKIDLAVSHYGSRKFAILFGDGSGSFQSASCNVEPLTEVLSADVNNDGKIDLVGSNDVKFSSPCGLEVMLGNGDGTFQTPVGYGSGLLLEHLSLADVNHDGNLDAIAMSDRYAGKVSEFFGRSDGTFTAPSNQVIKPNLFTLVVAPLDGDSNLDLLAETAVVQSGKGELLTLPGDGKGAFRRGPKSHIAGVAVSVVAADLDGDGKADAIGVYEGTDQATSKVVVARGAGDGSFH